MPSSSSKSKMSQASKHKRQPSDKASSRKQSNASKSSQSSTPNSESTSMAGHGSTKSSSKFEYNLAQFSRPFAPYVSTPSTDQQAFYNQQYSTEVILGCTSLGVEVPVSMHQALVNQHGSYTPGEFLHSTIAVGPQYTGDFQYQIMDDADADADADADWRLENVSTDHAYNCMRGDLAGVGAQFEGLNSVHKC